MVVSMPPKRKKYPLAAYATLLKNQNSGFPPTRLNFEEKHPSLTLFGVRKKFFSSIRKHNRFPVAAILLNGSLDR